MRDLELFWLLTRADDPSAGDGARLAKHLEALAEEPIHTRAPFLGLLPRVLRHDDARVRAAALTALAGADGPNAWPALVGALDDGDAHVRVSALAALHTSSTSQPMRWVHALFHSDPDVRQSAVEGGAPSGAAAFAFYLLADEASAPSIRASGVELPLGAIPALLDFARSGVVTADEARLWLSKLAWNRTARWLEKSHRRTPSEIDRILNLLGDTAPTQPDALDGLFRLFLDDAADEEVRRTFFSKLEAAMFSSPFALRRRIIASILVTFRELRWFLPQAAGICALFFHRFLTAAWIPRDVRYSALSRVYVSGRRVPRANDEQVRAMVLSDLVQPKKGVVDVWALGAVLHYCRNNPYSLLWEWLKVDDVVDAFLADMEGCAPFLTLPDTSNKGRKWLMAKIVARAPDRRGDVLAFLVVAANADELTFLETMTTETLLECFVRLVVLEKRPDVDISQNKLDRLAHRLGEVLRDAHLTAFFTALLALPNPEESPIGRAVLGAVARALTTEVWLGHALSLSAPSLRKLLGMLPYTTTVPWGKELALAHALVDHVSSTISDWAELRVPAAKRPPPARRSSEIVLIPPEVERRIVDAPEADLPEALTPCLSAPHRGLTEALGRRPVPTHPSADACAALLGSHDDPGRVGEELERYGSHDAEFESLTSQHAVSAWRGNEGLPVLGHIFMYRFEQHVFMLADQLEARPDGVYYMLETFAYGPSGVLASRAFAAIARLLSILRWRGKARLDSFVHEGLLDLAIEQLDSDLGRHAAQILMAFYDARLALPELSKRRADVSARVADFDDETRRILDKWITSRGLPPRARALRPRREPAGAELLATIRKLTDLDVLEAHCRSEHAKLVHEATLRLVELGEEGLARLAAILTSGSLPPEWTAITDSVALWPDSRSISTLEVVARDEKETPELRFRLALGLVERGNPDLLESAIGAALVATDESWVLMADWIRLQKTADLSALARRLAAAPHPHAYRPSAEHLLGLEELADEDRSALRDFLNAGTDRIGDLRRRAASRLLADGDPIGYPILISELFRGEEVDETALVRTAPELLPIALNAALFAGPKVADEKKVLPLLDHEAAPRAIRDELLQQLLTDCQGDGLRQSVVQRLARRPSRAAKLRAIADTFAWGVRVGRELTGRIFRFHMIGGRGLGYTRLSQNRIHVSPLPLLRGARHGREVVEALVLHEIGHHVHHRGEKEAEVWAEAQKEGVQGLLNLVADEHLERNLRALDRDYGNKLKRLAAYAFAHSARELPVLHLFAMLQGRSFEVLTRIRLGVARSPNSVRVDNGSLLSEMERSGLRFAKFVRALRMGLGNRHGEPLVDEALEMFDKSFRKGDMRNLLAITYRLRDMFGAEVNIMECFGGHEALGEDGADRIIHGEGIEDDEVQREVERVLDPRRSRDEGVPTPGGRLILNVNPNEHFELITSIERIPYDAARHREESQRVARQARHMRRYLHDLGLSLVPRRMRLRGRRFDKSRATAVVTRRDPRMLISRETQVTTDLFLGVIVDCSGSMAGRSMERARAFGVLLADAARGLPGIDVRLFGFTDRLIYDAGDAKRPAVASLESGGGNNDAAALHYVAQVARASHRKARLLVMISDGMPTECSVAALKGLVTRLSRREGMCCAQVAVRPLAEKCFPHYVEVMDDEFDVAVRRFGNIIAGLVKKAMAA